MIVFAIVKSLNIPDKKRNLRPLRFKFFMQAQIVWRREHRITDHRQLRNAGNFGAMQCIYSRYHSRFFVRVVHDTMYAGTGSSRLMRISLLGISLLRFFKTSHTYLANAIIIFFILFLRFYVYFANAILCAIYFVTAII